VAGDVFLAPRHSTRVTISKYLDEKEDDLLITNPSFHQSRT